MEPSADFSAIIARVRELGPFPDDVAAESAVVATLQALARFLTEDERAELARALPPEVCHVVPATRSTSSPIAWRSRQGDLYLWVAVAEGVPIKRAIEHAQVVCRTLGEHLPDATVSRLLRNLPEIGALFAPADVAERVDGSAAPPATHHDLAEGHEGGRHPLADANPAILAHRHSVARNADPHADSRLSTARGLTQEREEDTLAEGEPGSHRPLSRTH